MAFLGTFTPFEPKTKFRFALQIGGSSSVLDQVPYYLCKAVTLPKISNNLIELKGINSKTYIKGRTEWEPITITLYDIIPESMDMSNDPHSLLYEWMMNHIDKQLDPRYAYEPDLGYKIDFTIFTLDPGKAIENLELQGPGTELSVVEKWQIKGAMIENINFGELDWSSEDAREIELTVRFDYAEYENVNDVGFNNFPKLPRPVGDTGGEDGGTGWSGTIGMYRDYTSLDRQGYKNPMPAPPPRGRFSAASAALIAAYAARRAAFMFRNTR